MNEPKTYLSQPRVLATKEFIESNSLSIRPHDEIVEKYKDVKAEESFFDFRPEVLIQFLTFESAKPFFKPEYVAEVEAGTKEWTYVDTIEEAAQDFLDYMNFAWGKAEDERGISASRSIQKLSMWLWIMGREDLADIIHKDSLYNPYGAPALIEVCRLMGIEVPESLVEFSKHKC